MDQEKHVEILLSLAELIEQIPVEKDNYTIPDAYGDVNTVIFNLYTSPTDQNTAADSIKLIASELKETLRDK